MNLRKKYKQFKKRADKAAHERALKMHPTAYALFRKLPLSNKKVFFESMSNRSFNDNPKAIYEELARRDLGYKLIWALKKKNVDVGPAGTVAPFPSFRYWYHLATARWIVSNMNQYKVVKRKGQIMVQTMHGIPLKHMGLTVAKRQVRIAEQKRLSQEYWDYFVSPCRYMTDIVRGESYLFEGEVLEVGYPRNDFIVNNADNDDIRAKVREELGVPDGKKIILYAPTWRTKKRFDLKLDLERCREALGDDWVIVLRAHYLESKYVKKKIYDDFVINGHAYANANELAIAADALITDYSSIMFDFALLERPIVLFCWDYERYVERSRGTYFDLRDDYPTLIAETTEEVLSKLGDPDSVMSEVRAMKARFGEFDDGHASERTVDALWGSGKRP